MEQLQYVVFLIHSIEGLPRQEYSSVNLPFRTVQKFPEHHRHHHSLQTYLMGSPQRLHDLNVMRYTTEHRDLGFCTWRLIVLWHDVDLSVELDLFYP